MPSEITVPWWPLTYMLAEALPSASASSGVGHSFHLADKTLDSGPGRGCKGRELPFSRSMGISLHSTRRSVPEGGHVIFAGIRCLLFELVPAWPLSCAAMKKE